MDFDYIDSPEGRFIEVPLWFVDQKNIGSRSLDQILEETLYEPPFKHLEVCVIRTPKVKLYEDTPTAVRAWKTVMRKWLKNMFILENC